MKAISHLTQILNFNWQNTIHYNEILIQIVTTDIWRNYNTIDKDETCKTDGIKTIYHNRIESRLYNKKNKNTSLRCT